MVVLALLPLELAGCLLGPRQEMKRNNYIDDLVVAARVKDALAADADHTFSAVQVSAENGKPVLSGAVKAPEGRARAEEIAREVSGAKAVKNEIMIRS
jgi:osmotically-inducible protein OsmY